MPSDPFTTPSSAYISSLWRDRDFRRLWAGQTASQLGEQSGQVILPLIAVLALDAGPGQLGVLRAVEQAPILLLSLLAGAWVDRRRSRTVMVSADLARAVALAALPVAYLFGVLGVPALLVVAFVVGALGVFFDVAYQASLVRLVRRDQLMLGNSALEGSRSAARIGGPALGGALVTLLSAPVAAVAGAFFFLLSFLSIRRIRRHEPMPDREGREGRQAERPPRIWRQIREGLQLVVGDGSLWAVGIASALFQFSFAAVMTVYLLFLPRGLHLSGAEVGLALAATGPGAVVGSLLAARLPGRFGHGMVLVSSAVVATINFVGMGLTPLGSLLGGLLAGEWGLRTGLLMTAVALALSPLYMAFSPLAHLGKELPRG
ncbi:MFS transporter [Streptomyces sp. NPDC086554]|uniref:MFS transporter n=1 Tax=Streptomyces sp. NPDC086554 TaxID=3154864 RepID=UPI0034402FB3